MTTEEEAQAIRQVSEFLADALLTRARARAAGITLPPLPLTFRWYHSMPGRIGWLAVWTWLCWHVTATPWQFTLASLLGVVVAIVVGLWSRGQQPAIQFIPTWR